MNDSPTPQIIALIIIFLATIATIVAGYFHGHMHLITTLQNAVK